MKLLAILIAFGACALAGLRLSQRLQARATLLTSLREDMRTLLSAARLSRKPLSVLVAERGSLRHGPLIAQYCILRETQTADAAWQALWQSPPLGGGWREAPGGVVRPQDYNALTDQEQRAVADMLAAFTTDDWETLSRRGDEAVALLDAHAQTAAAESAAKGRIYRSIGLLLGAAISILML